VESIKTSMDTIVSLMDDAFKEGMTFTFPSKGKSMLPLLHDNDLVTVDRIKTLKKGDIVLYKRNNGQYVLHRIRKIKKDKSFIMVGDHQRKVEYGIKESQILAVLIAYKKNNKEYHLKGFRYSLYKLFIKSSIIRWFNSKLFK